MLLRPHRGILNKSLDRCLDAPMQARVCLEAVEQQVVISEVAFQRLLAPPQLAGAQEHHLGVHQLRDDIQDHVWSEGRVRRAAHRGRRSLLDGRRAQTLEVLEADPGLVLRLLVGAALAVAPRLLCDDAAGHPRNGVLEVPLGPREVLCINGKGQELGELLLPDALAHTVLEALLRQEVIDAGQVMPLLPVGELLGLQGNTDAKDRVQDASLRVEAAHAPQIDISVHQLPRLGRTQVQRLGRHGGLGRKQSDEAHIHGLTDLPRNPLGGQKVRLRAVKECLDATEVEECSIGLHAGHRGREARARVRKRLQLSCRALHRQFEPHRGLTAQVAACDAAAGLQAESARHIGPAQQTSVATVEVDEGAIALHTRHSAGDLLVIGTRLCARHGVVLREGVGLRHRPDRRLHRLRQWRVHTVVAVATEALAPPRCPPRLLRVAALVKEEGLQLHEYGEDRVAGAPTGELRVALLGVGPLPLLQHVHAQVVSEDVGVADLAHEDHLGRLVRIGHRE
mmetsp:Transcript_83183/g.114824  ORF Transcript_83183/g.114824 Transcript_83183/m.114824 type:complete len:510 (+) Transcript_83183:1507-3036(+)